MIERRKTKQMKPGEWAIQAWYQSDPERYHVIRVSGLTEAEFVSASLLQDIADALKEKAEIK